MDGSASLDGFAQAVAGCGSCRNELPFGGGAIWRCASTAIRWQAPARSSPPSHQTDAPTVSPPQAIYISVMPSDSTARHIGLDALISRS